MNKIKNEVVEVLAASTIDNNILFLPKVQLERKLYEDVNKYLVILGGKWNRKSGGHVFDENPSDAIDELLLTRKITDRKKSFNFFPTPPALAREVCELAKINSECDVLEPSAGSGNIADAILTYLPKSVTVVELDENKAQYLEGKYTHCFVGQDFMEWQPNMFFDRIVMNPPFAKKQDIKHIMRAFKLLKPGGILVSILSPSPFFCMDKLSMLFRNWIEAYSDKQMDIDEGAFKDSGTMIRTKVIRAVKPL